MLLIRKRAQHWLVGGWEEGVSPFIGHKGRRPVSPISTRLRTFVANEGHISHGKLSPLTLNDQFWQKMGPNQNYHCFEVASLFFSFPYLSQPRNSSNGVHPASSPKDILSLLHRKLQKWLKLRTETLMIFSGLRKNGSHRALGPLQ